MSVLGRTSHLPVLWTVLQDDYRMTVFCYSIKTIDSFGWGKTRQVIAEDDSTEFTVEDEKVVDRISGEKALVEPTSIEQSSERKTSLITDSKQKAAMARMMLEPEWKLHHIGVRG